MKNKSESQKDPGARTQRGTGDERRIGGTIHQAPFARCLENNNIESTLHDAAALLALVRLLQVCHALLHARRSGLEVGFNFSWRTQGKPNCLNDQQQTQRGNLDNVGAYQCPSPAHQ